MRSGMSKIARVAACAVMLVASAALAQQEKELEVGKPAPAFQLPGVDGKQVSLADTIKKNKVTVVTFTCNACPVAKAYEDRLIQIQKDYKDKGVQVVAINSNDPKIVADDSFEKMKERAKEKSFNFPYVFDESQATARAYGAKVTPHVYVVNQEGKLIYRGAVDDSQNPQKAQKHYLRAALDAALEGKPVPTAETKAFGCTVKYRKEEARPQS